MGNVLRPDGNKIKTLRVKKGWPREQLAQIADVRSRTIQKVEADSNASFETLRAIAGAFGLEVHELMKGSAKTAAGRIAGSRLHLRPLSAETFAPLLAWCLPYAPAAKGLMASFTLVLLAASAIYLSPFLVERDEEPVIVDFPQSFAQASPSVSSPERAVPQPMPKTEARTVTPRALRPVRSAAAVRNDDRVSPAPVLAKPAPMSGAIQAEHPGTSAVIPAAQTASAIQTMPWAVHSDWLAGLARLGPTIVSPFGQSPSKTTSTPPRGITADFASRGSAGGYNVLGRPFVRSGKSTAAFFAKVGGSIKRAF